MFWHLDGTDFSRYNYFECSPKYNEDTGYEFTQAINACRDDTNCSMVGSSNCDIDNPNYYFCAKDPEILDSDLLTACTWRKKGMFCFC